MCARRPDRGDPEPLGAAEQTEQAESELRRLGLADVRVRPHGDVARLEVPAVDIVTVCGEPLREAVLLAVRSAGFRFVAVDLTGSDVGAQPIASRGRP